MSQIVLGGASFTKLSNSDLATLLGTAANLGVNKIDTAPLYGESELKIGAYLKKSRNYNWWVSTKVGLPNKFEFNPSGIVKQVDQSLKNLQIDRIDTLFIHSLSPNYLNIENIDTLDNLKKIGKVKLIGYSGDNLDLNYAVDCKKFDSIMATFNPLDLGNYDSIQKATTRGAVFLKRILGSGVLNRSFQKSLINKIRQLKHLDFKLYQHEYAERLKFFKPDTFQNVSDYLNFARAVFPNALLVAGTGDQKHLKQLREIEDSFNPLTQDQVDLRLSEYVRLGLSSQWAALT
jgi:aryl-alcohol dehydrogenase-like predicted oxidoreductase